jgi:hypothetical protein
MSQSTPGPNRNRWLVIVAILSAMVMLSLGGWVIVGLMTASHDWTAAMDLDRGLATKWFRPRSIAVVSTSPEADAIVAAVRDELDQRGWIDEVIAVPHDQTTSGRIDFFILVGPPWVLQAEYHGARWERQTLLYIAAGLEPAEFSKDTPDQLVGPTDGFVTPQLPDAIARRVVRQLGAGPGYMQHVRAFWIMRSDDPPAERDASIIRVVRASKGYPWHSPWLTRDKAPLYGVSFIENFTAEQSAEALKAANP